MIEIQLLRNFIDSELKENDIFILEDHRFILDKIAYIVFYKPNGKYYRTNYTKDNIVYVVEVRRYDGIYSEWKDVVEWP